MTEPVRQDCWLQLSAGQGPAECAWVVARLLDQLSQQAIAEGLHLEVIEAEPAERPQTLKSALLSLSGSGAEAFAQHWQGTIQWIGTSPFRPHHRRKNWYVGVQLFAPPAENSWSPEDFRFEATRSGGPGGQHVNKVETAVRITHLPSGLSIVASQERSQWRNRQLGLARLIGQLRQQHDQQVDQARNSRWQAHHRLERGNAGHCFEGPAFRRRAAE